MGGFSYNPTVNLGDTYVDTSYGIYLYNGDQIEIYENGGQVAVINVGTVVSSSDVWKVDYDGTSVKYYYNSTLLYTNKIFKAKNLTESQKVKVLAAFDKAASVKEAKLVFETLSEGFKEKKNPVNESLLRGSASKPAGIAEKKPILEVNDQFARWQQLAGIVK